jgi:erythrocyte band 7 integral membrane protein
MQIRQLEALQQMAKSANSKVVFVPMQLQSDIVGAMSRAEGSGAAIEGSSTTGAAGRAGLINAMGNI